MYDLFFHRNVLPRFKVDKWRAVSCDKVSVLFNSHISFCKMQIQFLIFVVFPLTIFSYKNCRLQIKFQNKCIVYDTSNCSHEEIKHCPIRALHWNSLCPLYQCQTSKKTEQPNQVWKNIKIIWPNHDSFEKIYSFFWLFIWKFYSPFLMKFDQFILSFMIHFVKISLSFLTHISI